jgi:plastocyanin
VTKKLLAIAVAGGLAGFAGMALADDMSQMDMSHMGGMPAAQVAATAPNAVAIDNFAFAPQTVTVAAGTAVTWTNHDDEPHTVVSDDNPSLFKSGGLDTDDTFSFTFAKPGTYKYHCSIHPRMTGTVVVK